MWIDPVGGFCGSEKNFLTLSYVSIILVSILIHIIRDTGYRFYSVCLNVILLYLLMDMELLICIV